MEQTYTLFARGGMLPFPGLYAVCTKAGKLLIGAISKDLDDNISIFQSEDFIVATNTKEAIKFFVQRKEFFLGTDQETEEDTFLSVLNPNYEEEDFFLIPLIKRISTETILLLKAYEEYRDQIQDAIPDLFRYCEVKAERPRRGTTKPEL